MDRVLVFAGRHRGVFARRRATGPDQGGKSQEPGSAAVLELPPIDTRSLSTRRGNLMPRRCFFSAFRADRPDVASPGCSGCSAPTSPLSIRAISRRPATHGAPAGAKQAAKRGHERERHNPYGPSCHEIRRHVRRRHRPHPQCRAPRQARDRRRPRSRGRRVGDGGRYQPARRLVRGGAESAAHFRRARIRCGRRHRRAGDRGPVGDHAAGHGHQRALLDGLAASDPDLERPRLRAHSRRQRRRTDPADERERGKSP